MVGPLLKGENMDILLGVLSATVLLLATGNLIQDLKFRAEQRRRSKDLVESYREIHEQVKKELADDH